MSLKRKIRYQINSLKNSLYSWQLPNWLESTTSRMALACLVLVFSVGYVYQISSTAVSGYTIHDLETQVKQLEREIQKLEVEVADQGTMKNIQANLETTDMVAVADIQYYEGRDVMVAKR